MRIRLAALILLTLSLFVPSTPSQAQEGGTFRVYLTFEDGPTEWYTPAILDTLAQYNARATFFVNGYQIEGREAILQRMLYEGHAIGNHLWVEPGHYAGATDDVIRESYFRTEAALQQALADALPLYEAQTKLFRTPGGGAKPFPLTSGVDVISYNWNVSGNDCGSAINWDSDLSVDAQVLRNIFENQPRWNVWDYGDGVVIALHDINRVTGRILPTLLSRLQAAGATFHALPRPQDQLNTMPIVLGAPPLASGGYPQTRLPGTILDNVYLRATPIETAMLIQETTIPTHTVVMATGRHEGWYRIEFNGQIGWVFGNYLRIEGPIPNLVFIE